MSPTNHPLTELGWTAHWDGQLAASPTTGRPARVVRVDRSLCVVHTGHIPFVAENPSAPALVTGDWVVLDPVADTVLAVLPRRTAFTRGAGRTDTRGQVLAANIDVVGIVHPLSTAPNLGRIERYLALAWSSGAQPVVILAKSDLSGDPAGDRAETVAACPGAAVLAVSAVTGAGLDELRAAFPAGSTGVLLGPSGAGKSSLVNALAGADVLRTQEIRADGKGRHTSVARELVALPSGALLIDTPGLRGVQLWDASDGIDAAFADVTELADRCRFNDCAHDSEPGCAVRAAVASGELGPRRLASWQKLLREQDWLAGRYDARLRAEQRAVWKQRVKEARGRSRP